MLLVETEEDARFDDVGQSGGVGTSAGSLNPPLHQAGLAVVSHGQLACERRVALGTTGQGRQPLSRAIKAL